MGGESIKPIRKRIHVYFLMTAYELVVAKLRKVEKQRVGLIKAFHTKSP